ncbi:hypothetical protein BGZ63DRAFT_5241 [Mariannaea sp. PMI_226]|nr:hypothetical protein BGZ63DRAFT_5241 [Mariannaea sp. PMI_226]
MHNVPGSPMGNEPRPWTISLPFCVSEEQNNNKGKQHQYRSTSVCVCENVHGVVSCQSRYVLRNYSPPNYLLSTYLRRTLVFCPQVQSGHPILVFPMLVRRWGKMKKGWLLQASRCASRNRRPHLVTSPNGWQQKRLTYPGTHIPYLVCKVRTSFVH